MTRDETCATLMILRAAYPGFYAKMPVSELNSIVDLWEEMFCADDAVVVKYALKQLIATHSGYPPDIAELKDMIADISRAAKNEPTDGELWNILSDTVENKSAYSWELRSAFDSLPPVIQTWLGSPSRLHDLGMMESVTFQSVTRGQFLKSLPAMRKRIEFRDSLPQAVREAFAQIGKPIPSEETYDLDERRNNLLKLLAERIPEQSHG